MKKYFQDAIQMAIWPIVMSGIFIFHKFIELMG
jgi:hypothetical protein